MRAKRNLAISAERAALTSTQNAAGREVGRITDAERARRTPTITPTITHPIDNVEPNVLADRDDGVFVETEPLPNGNTRVHVTIADVAGHIPPDHPLAEVAHTRAFTKYRPWGNDTMFPPESEAQMSLEHGQERLGMTVTIELDRHFQPAHTTLARTIVTADCKHYDAVQAAAENSAQFQAMARIATGIRDHYLRSSSPQLLEEQDRSLERLHLSAQQIAARKMVEAYMLLANRTVAELFKTSALPFLYRNLIRTDASSRAEYSPDAHGHDDMSRDQAYCHFTSPIRRGADTLCQHMAHYVIDREEALAAALAPLLPEVDAATLHHTLWQEAPHWLGGLGRNRPREMSEALASVPLLATVDHHTLQRVAAEVTARRPPYTEKQFRRYARHINQLNLAEQKSYNTAWGDTQKHADALANLQRLTPETLREATRDNLSIYLECAARTGHLPPILRDETIARIKAGTLNSARDGLTIMLRAPFAMDADWNLLKRRMASILKHAPGEVNTLLTMAEREGLLPKYQLTVAQLPMLESGRHPEPSQIETAIATYVPQGKRTPVSTPYYSVGHDRRAAESHARYSFIEHLAFGQLVPLRQHNLPNLLYAELNNSTPNKRILVERMVAEAGGHITFEQVTPHHHIARMDGGPFLQPLRLEVVDASPDLAESSLLRRILRHPLFKAAVSNARDPMLQKMSDPHATLSAWVQSHNGTVTTHYAENTRDKRSNFTCTTTLQWSDGRTQTFEGAGNNKDRARGVACSKALQQLGVMIEEEAHAKPHRSWATRSRSNPAEASPVR